MENLKIKNIRRFSSFVICFLIVVCACMCFFHDDSAVMVSSNNEKAIYYGNKNGKYVALMFNCYEGKEQILSIAKTLEDFGFKATFFFGGCFADDNIDLIINLANRGFEIGNHGYFHKSHSKLSYEQNVSEIKNTHNVIAYGAMVNCNLFAPPSGDFSKTTLKASRDLGYRTIMWSKDTIDWRDNDKKLIFDRATKNVGGGDFVLMHPKKHTAEVLKDVIDFYIQKGLKVGTVSQCIE